MSRTLLVGLLAEVLTVIGITLQADGLQLVAVGAALTAMVVGTRMAWPLAARVHQVREDVMLERLAKDPATRASLDQLADDVEAGRLPRRGKALDEYKERWGR